MHTANTLLFREKQDSIMFDIGSGFATYNDIISLNDKIYNLNNCSLLKITPKEIIKFKY